jgi:hypothetical protein
MGRTRNAIGLSAVVVAVVALVVALGAAGGRSPRRASGPALSAARDNGPRRASGPFAWLRPGSPPAGWHLARIPTGADLAYPPGWAAIETDPGTASVAVLGDAGAIDGYLNLTPRQGAETLANWSRFRPQKNREEGERDLRLLASAENLRFRAGRGSCVIDSYTTTVTSYEEIACLVSGAHRSSVVVAAAPTRLWQQRSAVLEQAVSSFLA